jgi:asparagine synthase (glutamine-hydrolysing)
MCGICGKLSFDNGASVPPALMKAMADTIYHRGPDDEGFYFSGPVGLGFRRLSIIDLNSGAQPISNEDGSVWIVFNGEIYNYQELRDYLLTKGHIFRTKTDTEVIVHLYEEFRESCVERLRGMFSFAIWDDRQKVLFLARDRVGIKPLYYWLGRNCLIFGSEIKAILADPTVKPEILPAMIDRFLTFYYVPGEETLFQGILKLAPGSYMVVRDGKTEIRQYWDLNFVPVKRSLREAEAELLYLLGESVRLHMISDVPVGFLLSGGVDSTAMLSLAVGKTGQPITAYTVGFDDPGITDERPYARLAARRYGIEHHDLMINARDFADFLPKYVWHMEEPVCEPPGIALYYVSKLAKDFVKVLISGEGGDEAFGGYPNYRSMLMLERMKSVFKPLNGIISRTLSILNRQLDSKRIAKYAPLFDTPFESYYYSRTSTPFTFFNSRALELYSDKFARTVNKKVSLLAVKRFLEGGPVSDLVNKMLYVDTKTWLPDDLLIKADRMTMANSVELRVPLLDHKVLDFAASLPGTYKVRGVTTKYLAKRTVKRLVPNEIIKRKKAGFPVPYASWLRGDLKDWLHDILLDRTTLSRGYFKKSGIQLLLRDALRSGNHSQDLFSLVVLELWHREFLDKGNATVRHPADTSIVVQG